MNTQRAPASGCTGYFRHPFVKEAHDKRMDAASPLCWLLRASVRRHMFHHVDRHALESVMSGALVLWYSSPGQFRQLMIDGMQQDHSWASLGSTPSTSTSTSFSSESRFGPARGA